MFVPTGAAFALTFLHLIMLLCRASKTNYIIISVKLGFAAAFKSTLKAL